MPLPGIKSQDETDFPNSVKESQSILPFFAGGETQLGVTDVPEDLVLVSSLRRFENKTFVAEGTHTGGNNSATTLIDSTADFINWGVQAGDVVINTTDSSAVWAVDSVDSATQLTVSLTTTGGVDDDFDTNDVYHVNKGVSHQNARAEIIRKVRIMTDLDCYIEFDGEADSATHLVRLNAGDALDEDHIRIVSRINFINVTTGDQPTLRWYVMGL